MKLLLDKKKEKSLKTKRDLLINYKLIFFYLLLFRGVLLDHLFEFDRQTANFIFQMFIFL